MLDFEGEAHEIWAMAQLMPNEGVVDGVGRIKKKLEELAQQTHNSAMDAIAILENAIGGLTSGGVRDQLLIRLEAVSQRHQ